MLKKVYFSKDIDNCVYELRRDFPESEVLYCSELDFNEFCLKHTYNLMSSNTVIALVGVDKFKSSDLLNLLASEIEADVCWALKKVDKRTKLYKRMKECSNVEECLDLEDNRRKKSFITSRFKEKGISTKYMGRFLQVCSNSKAIIDRELDKLKIALEVLPESTALMSLTVHKVDSHTLNFVSSLFSGKEDDTIFLASRIAHVPLPVLSTILTKRLQSLIFLAIDCQDKAKEFWDHRGFYLKKDTACAKTIGYSNLLEIYSYVDSVFSDFTRKDSEYLKLSKLIRFVYSLRF